MTPLLDIPQAAIALGTTDRHIRRLVETRQIPFVKVGRKVRFKQRDLERWIETNTTPVRTDWR